LGREADFSTSLRFGRNDDAVPLHFGRNDDALIFLDAVGYVKEEQATANVQGHRSEPQ